MKFALSSVAAVAAVSLQADFHDELLSTTLGAVDKFEVYKGRFEKKYENGQELTAFAAFAENERIIQEHNAGNYSWTLGHNEYSDLTWNQFKNLYVSDMEQNPHSKRSKSYDHSLLQVTDMPKSLDWREKGAVSPVKNQGQCGSCWAFSTVGAMEGAFAVAGNPLTEFSEQELVSCDNKDNGCNGGLMDNAFGWIESHGICTEDSDPYTSGQGRVPGCGMTDCQGAATLTGYTDVPGEDGMLAALQNGPVAVAIEADRSTFQLYKGGVLDDSSCGDTLDHGVLMVAYGTDEDSGKDYYTIKNSWGASWGENGFIRFVRGKNQCGVASMASYPTGVKTMGPSPGPAPGPSPGPAPGPSPHSASHYDDPKSGCQSDELPVRISGIAGDFCSPACRGFFGRSCPKDVPAGVTASPQCVLNAGDGGMRCALTCDPSSITFGDNTCGTGSCQSVGNGVGICTYSA